MVCIVYSSKNFYNRKKEVDLIDYCKNCGHNAVLNWVPKGGHDTLEYSCLYFYESNFSPIE